MTSVNSPSVHALSTAPLLAELVALFSIHPHRGGPPRNACTALGRSLAIAVLIDLVDQKRLEAQTTASGNLQLRAIGEGPIRDPLLAEVWQSLPSNGTALELVKGLNQLPILGSGLTERIRQRLLSKGWIQQSDHKVLGMLRRVRQTTTDLSPVTPWREALRRALESDDPQPSAVVSLLVLLQGTNALSAHVPPADWPRFRRRVNARMKSVSFKGWYNSLQDRATDDTTWILLLTAMSTDSGHGSGASSSDGASGSDGGGGDGGGGSD